jgi:YceI-like domain
VQASYQVWGRALGQPGGSVTVTTYAIDPSTGEVVCSAESTLSSFVRHSGKQTFTNVTNELTSIVVSFDGGLTYQRVALFSGGLQDFLWQYANKGLRLLHLSWIRICRQTRDSRSRTACWDRKCSIQVSSMKSASRQTISNRKLPIDFLLQETLSLHGKTRLVSLRVVRSNGRYRGGTVLKQSDFGITPISIAGGTVKVRDEVRIEFDIVVGLVSATLIRP